MIELLNWVLGIFGFDNSEAVLPTNEWVGVPDPHG